MLSDHNFCTRPITVFHIIHASLPQVLLINHLSCLISYYLFSLKYFRLILRIRLPLFRFSSSSSERAYLLFSLFTLDCLLFVSTSVDLVYVVELGLESVAIITIVGHFLPNDILIGYATTKKKTAIHRWTPYQSFTQLYTVS